MSPVLCHVNSALPEGAAVSAVVRAHARTCLRCQARMARNRALRREIARLGSETLPAPPYLAATVMARLGDQAPDATRRSVLAGPIARRAAAAGVGMTAAAAAAVITGLAVRKSRAV